MRAMGDKYTIILVHTCRMYWASALGTRFALGTCMGHLVLLVLTQVTTSLHEFAWANATLTSERPCQARAPTRNTALQKILVAWGRKAMVS